MFFSELLKLVNIYKVRLKYSEESVTQSKLIKKISGGLNLLIRAVTNSFQRILSLENDDSKVVCLGEF